MVIIFIFSAVLSFCFARLARRAALCFKIIDAPFGERKRHKTGIPLLGGLAPYAAFFIASFSALYSEILPAAIWRPLFWLFIASTVIMIGGFFDDKYNLHPKRQIIFPIIAIALAVFGGVRVQFITNPVGGILFLSAGASLAVSFAWLLVISYTTKILDGLDGLVGGTAALGAMTIFLFTTLTDFKEPSLSVLSLILAGSFFGFLTLNRYPAKLFLGEGGSVFAGFILGGLAIMTGAKIATTLMVMALPLIDLLAVIVKRAMRRRPIFSGDRTHLHYLLVDRGWKPQYVVYLFWGSSAFLGIMSVFLPSGAKVITLAVVLATFFLIDIFWIKET